MKIYNGHIIPEGATHFSEVSQLHPFYRLTPSFGYYDDSGKAWVKLPNSWAEDYNLKEIDGVVFVGEGNSGVKSERDMFLDTAINVMNDSIDDSQEGWALALYDNGARFTEQSK